MKLNENVYEDLSLYQNGLSASELVALADPETSTNSFVQEVAALVNKSALENELRQLSEGQIVSMDDQRITNPLKRFNWGLQKERPSGIGYLTSSQHHDRRLEVFWTALCYYLAKREGFHPLVVPVDAMYSYRPDCAPALPNKIRYQLSDMDGVMFHQDKDPYLILLSGFADSVVFDEATLQKVPQQGNMPPSDTFNDFCSYKLCELLGHHKALAKLVEAMAANKKDRTEDIKLTIATALLAANGQSWQMLCYQSKHGIPLYIVAPQSFHAAMNRLNALLGHGAHDYHYRADNSLGANDHALVALRDGKIVEAEDMPPINHFKGGISKEEMAHVLTILES